MDKYSFEPLVFLNIGKGCSKISPACDNCYIKVFDDFILDEKWESRVTDTQYEVGTTFVTSTSTDLFYTKLDNIRDRYWEIVKSHPEYIFMIITKRVERITECLPSDWNDGYDNVIIILTIENQRIADYRIPLFEKIPCKHKALCCTPLLEDIDISKYLANYHYDLVQCSGEKGNFFDVRPLYVKWVENLSNQCKDNNTRFAFIHGGTKLVDKDGSIINDTYQCYNSLICFDFNLNNYVPIKFNLNGKDIIK